MAELFKHKNITAFIFATIAAAAALAYFKVRPQEYAFKTQFLIEAELGQRLKTYLDSPEGFAFFTDRINRYSEGHLQYPLDYNRLVVINKNKKLAMVYRFQVREDAELFSNALPLALRGASEIMISTEKVGRALDAMYAFREYLQAAPSYRPIQLAEFRDKKSTISCSYGNITHGSYPEWQSFVSQVDGAADYLKEIIEVNSLNPQNLETSIQITEKHAIEYAVIIFSFAFITAYLFMFWFPLRRL